ncbi:diguanylate cyclase [Betaproteobacteria bacterium]|nr:diguanylate cyclase [Betaproteobacteria bacterium]GHT94108.1 diguanylate cyclase [Betaproteobacteria bacterium]GHU03171.1 diguanylate cyclase [Betaproteobacteria bacterium]GHU12837.1 diguanylate cyclase [Betaproteobacteria bacterium]GHU19760.1 diguanylate cyclase [Betaproteobacteria bacterium]
MQQTDFKATDRQTLFDALLHIFFWSTVAALFCSGVLFAGGAFVALRLQFEDNMALVARTAAYSIEPAVMFSDREAAREILDVFIEREHLCEMRVFGVDGSEFVSARRNCTDSLSYLGMGSLMADYVVASTDISSGKQQLGTIEIHGDVAVFSDFVQQALFIMFVCLLAAVFGASALARLLERRLVAELGALASVARLSRLEGSFSQRLPRFRISEFDGLAQDFNALLSEIQNRNAELELRQSQLEIMNGTLSKIAMCDSLTGLANRACFTEQLEKAVEAARASSTRISILYIDNDHFKLINDNYGHEAGDTLLVDVAHRLRGSVRDSDLVARLGGDEFAILLTQMRDEADARLVADKILAAMTRKLRLQDQVDVSLGVSIGIAIFPDHADNASMLLRASDQAMYWAKRQGRGRVRMYDPTLNDQDVEEKGVP